MCIEGFQATKGPIVGRVGVGMNPRQGAGVSDVSAFNHANTLTQ
jgi:hypothetical protein